MPRFKTFAAALLAGGALLAAAALAQSTGRWTIGALDALGPDRGRGGGGGRENLRDRRVPRRARARSLRSDRRPLEPLCLHSTAAASRGGGGLKRQALCRRRLFVEGWTPTDEVHEYDPASDRWQGLAALPTPRGALAAAVLGGKIHAVGGTGWRGRNTAAHEVYDPAANRWTALAHVPTARDHLAAAAIDGRVYAVGGRIDGNYWRNLGANEAYDPAADRWEQRASMPTARSGIAAAVLGGRMFVFGGEAPAGTFNQTQAYDAKSNGWSSHARMPTARHGLGAAAVAGRIYVISGGPTPGNSVSAANEIFVP